MVRARNWPPLKSFLHTHTHTSYNHLLFFLLFFLSLFFLAHMLYTFKKLQPSAIKRARTGASAWHLDGARAGAATSATAASSIWTSARAIFIGVIVPRPASTCRAGIIADASPAIGVHFTIARRARSASISTSAAIRALKRGTPVIRALSASIPRVATSAHVQRQRRWRRRRRKATLMCPSNVNLVSTFFFIIILFCV